MNIEELYQKADLNFQRHLKENRYPGRGIILGFDSGGAPVLLYWIMGRSENSRNRVFVLSKEGILQTKAADNSLVEDPSLIIYNAVKPLGNGFLVTNGDHTDRIATIIEDGGSLYQGLLAEKHEPDPPNFTPRIAGFLNQDTSGTKIELGIVCTSPFTPDHSEVHVHHLPILQQGFGFGITTYKEDGNPLPHFQDNPLLFPMYGKSNELADLYWNALDSENRVSLAMHTTGTIPASTAWEIRNSRKSSS